MHKLIRVKDIEKVGPALFQVFSDSYYQNSSNNR